MLGINSKEKAEFGKSMEEKDYSPIPVYFLINVKGLWAEILEVSCKIFEEYKAD